MKQSQKKARECKKQEESKTEEGQECLQILPEIKVAVIREDLMEANNAWVDGLLQGLDLLIQSLLAEGPILEDNLHRPLLFFIVTLQDLPHLGIGSAVEEKKKRRKKRRRGRKKNEERSGRGRGRKKRRFQCDSINS